MMTEGSDSGRRLSATIMADIETILEFWFGHEEPIPSDHQQRWFQPDPVFDRTCLERFKAFYEAAAAGLLDEWERQASGCLALVILLDQMPRNMFRDTARSFATDALALSRARAAIKAGLDRELPPLQRVFLYMPFQHSEDINDQEDSVVLFRGLSQEHHECTDFLRYAESHREVIRRFGRFPLRNAALGRPSTPDELSYLRDHSGY